MDEARINQKIEWDSDEQTVDASPNKGFFIFMITSCLLYTSDAADD